MRHRLLALLVVAACSGAAAGVVGKAEAGDAVERTAARIPPLETARVSGPRCPIPPEYRSAFEAAAGDTGVPISLLVAVGQVESNLRHDAVSTAGARGLLQLMPATAAELELDPDEPATNVLAGARYLHGLFGRFRSADLALAAYNAGPTAVERAGGAPTAAVLTYVDDVTARWRQLAGCR